MVLAVLCVLPVMLVNSKPLRVRALVTLVTLEHTPVVVLNPVHNATVVPTAKLVPYNASHAQVSVPFHLSFSPFLSLLDVLTNHHSFSLLYYHHLIRL